MGLDMYLIRNVYIPPIDDNLISANVNDHKFDQQVGYWRKANQIHNWFVKNVQDGVDDCRVYNVSKEQLRELKETCEKALEEKTEEAANDFLPTAQGFYYGSADYGPGYWEDLEETVKILDSILERDDSIETNGGACISYQYYSSW